MEKTNAELKAEIERLQTAIHRWMLESDRWQKKYNKLRQQNKQLLSEHKHLTDETIKIAKTLKAHLSAPVPLVIKSDDSNNEDYLYVDTDSIVKHNETDRENNMKKTIEELKAEEERLLTKNWKRKLQDTLYMDGAVTHMCNALGEVVLWDENFDGVDGLRVVVLAHPYARERYEITIEQDGRKWHAGFYETDPDTVEYRAFEAAYFFRNLYELFTLDHTDY